MFRLILLALLALAFVGCSSAPPAQPTGEPALATPAEAPTATALAAPTEAPPPTEVTAPTEAPPPTEVTAPTEAPPPTATLIAPTATAATGAGFTFIVVPGVFPSDDKPGYMEAATDELVNDQPLFRADPQLRLVTWAWPNDGTPPIEQPNGRGILAVTFRVTNELGETYTRREQNAPYCLFGGGERCADWDFAANGCRWPRDDLSGPSEMALAPGAYSMEIDIKQLVVTVNDAGESVIVESPTPEEGFRTWFSSFTVAENPAHPCLSP